MGTVLHDDQCDNANRQQRWERMRRAALLDQYGHLQAQGVSQRQAAKALDVPRTTLQAWRAWQARLDACPQVVAFFESGPGLAFLHQVEEAMVAYRREETARLVHEMPLQEITVTQDETFTGGLCLVAIEPVSNYVLLEQAAETRDQDTWNALMTDALAPLKCNIIQSTSDEAPGLLAYVEHHLGAHHSPDLFHVQHELSKAVAAPIAAKQRAAEKAVTTAEELLHRVSQPIQSASAPPERRGPGRPPKATPCREQARQAVEVARQEAQRLAHTREQIGQSIRAIGHAYHFVDLERGVRRNVKLIASDIQCQIDTIRTIATHEGLSVACMECIEKAARVVPKMPATIEFVSGYVRQPVRQLHLRQPESYAVHAHLIPSYYLERVAATRTMQEGTLLRGLAERIRTPLFAPGGALSALPPVEQDRLKHKAATLRYFSAQVPTWRDAMGISRCATTHYADSTIPESVHVSPRCTTSYSRVLTGRQQRSGFSGRSPGRSLQQSWRQSTFLPLP